MEIKEDVVIEEAKRVTGIIPYRVVALNPTLDELHKLGMTYVKQEPVYTSDKGLRLDFILCSLIINCFLYLKYLKHLI